MAGVGRSVAHDGYRQSFLALTVFCPDKPDEAMHEGKFGYREAPRTKGWRSGRPMLRLRELTAKVSATDASTERFMSVPRGWKSNSPGFRAAGN